MISRNRRSAGGLWLALAATALTAAAAGEASGLRVERGSTVQFEYALLLADGYIVETNIGGTPFRYVHGEDDMLPRLAAALEGMTVNEEKSVTLAPREAYGERNPTALREVPIEAVPYDARLVGAPYAVAGYDWPVLVSEVRDDAVVLDLNHPLAGRTLTFHIRILSIASGPEVQANIASVR